MWFQSLLSSWNSGDSRSRRPQLRRARRGTRLALEHLEDRCLPSSYSAANVSQLIADINAANGAGSANTITLTAPKTAPYVLTAVDNTTDGATGLPAIAANDNLTIVGNRDTVERSTASGTLAFRLMDIPPGASLTLQNLTLQGGLANSSGGNGLKGGAIYNQGTLILNAVTVQHNIAQALLGAFPVEGGAIYSSGALTLGNGAKIQNNQAIGGKFDRVVGNGYGGGIYVAGGTANLSNVSLSSNTAQGGLGGMKSTGSGSVGGDGFGGGLYVSSGTVNLSNVTLLSNTALGGRGGNGLSYGAPGGPGGNGWGGALQVSGGTVSVIGSTLSSNSALGGNGGNGTYPFGGGNGGNGFGGGIYVAGGTVTLGVDTLSSNAAQDGLSGKNGGTFGGPSFPGLGEGGGLYVAGGSVAVTSDTVESNSAVSSFIDDLGLGEGGALYVAGGTVTLTNTTVQSDTATYAGGGIYIVSTATVYLDPFTVANTINNTDLSGTNGSTANIDGSYILLSDVTLLSNTAHGGRGGGGSGYGAPGGNGWGARCR
jgi:hypothetical protein